jgi:lactate permease
MSISFSLVSWLFALLPIIALLGMMVGLQWGAKKAAPLGLLLAVLNGILIFKAPFSMIGYEAVKGLWSALVVLMVVWPAILLYEVVNKANAFSIIRQGIQKYTPNQLIQVLALGWCFTSFLQGITGFGVPVAVGAPLLIGIGVTPLNAVIIPLIGNAWAGTFGTLAVAWDSLVLQTQLSSQSDLLFNTALYAAFFILIWNIIIGLSITWLYGGWRALKKGWSALVLISAIQGGGQLVLVVFNTTLAAFLPSLIALIAIFFISRLKAFSQPWKIEHNSIMIDLPIEPTNTVMISTLIKALVPYMFLTGITLVVLLNAAIRSRLSTLQWSMSFPQTTTGLGYVNEAVKSYSPIIPFTNAGFFLLFSAIIALLYYTNQRWLSLKDSSSILNASLKKTWPSAIAVVCFIMMSRIMSGSGQILVLAQGIASFMGDIYGLFTPMVGLLGAFMTSSNMASNILFGDFQKTTAQFLSLNIAAILGAHTAGGAIGTAIAPGNIILGTTTAGILGQEGLILKKIIPITIVTALLIGLILFFIIL